MPDPHSLPEPEKSDDDAAPPASARVINASDWLQGEREIWIEHEGVRYRLRVTRRNRLILQK